MKKFNNPEKRIYSLNLLAFIEMKTHKETNLCNEGDLFYGVFPSSEEIAEIVEEYRNSKCQVNLHDYLNAFKNMRNRINDKRKGCN